MTIRSFSLTVGLACAALPLAAASGGAGPAARGPYFDAVRGTASDAYGRQAFVRAASASAPAAARPRGGTPADWHSLGPYGGDVTDVAASPSTAGLVLAGIAPGGGGGGTLYRSNDDAAHWAVVPELAGHSIYDIEFGSGASVYLAADNGVWTSADGGATWTQRDLGIGANQQVFDIALDPSNAAIVWAGVGDAFGQQSANVVRSTDGGLTWTDVTPPHPAMSCTQIAVDPANSSNAVAVFGGAFGGGEVWVTADGGATWTDRSAGLPANPMHAAAYVGSRILVGGGQLFGSQYVGLYASSDAGATWTKLDDASWPLAVVTAIAVDPNDPQTILAATDGAGINRSEDGGATWQVGIGGSTGLSAQSVRFAPGSSAQVLVGASSLGVYRSTDGGDHFGPASTGISELNLFAIDTSPTDPNQLAVAFQGSNNGGVLTSSDGGATWSAEPVPPTRYSNVRFAPDGTLYAMSSGPSTIAPEGLYRRNGDGSWTGIGPDQGPLYESDLVAIEFSRTDPSLIFLGGADFGVAGNQSTIWRSADAGQSWDKVYMGGEGDKFVDVQIVGGSQDQVLVAAYDGYLAEQSGGAARSTDGGATWEPALNGLPAFARMGRLCASAAAPGPVFLSIWDSWGTGALYRTDDDGATWVSTGWSGGNAFDVACDQEDPQVLYVAQSGADTVVRSADGGATFAPYATGLAQAGTPSALALSQTGTPLIYLSGTHGSFVSARSGGAPDRIFADGFD